jgi:hypothetical protein
MVISVMKKWMLISFLAAMIIIPPAYPAPQAKTQEGWPKWPGSDAWPKWPDQESLDSTFRETSKKLEIVKGLIRSGQDVEILQSKASDLLKRSKQAGDNLFKYERLLNASNALLDAAYGIILSRKADRVPQDFWGVNKSLQYFYPRVQQAGFLANMSGEKNSEQYVTLVKTLYHQAQSACDAHEYQKAKYLADASSSILTALESIAQAAIPAPAAPGMFK